MSMKTVLGPLRSIALVGLFGVAGVVASRAAAQPAVLPPRIAPTPPKIAEIRITSTQLKAGTVVAPQVIQTAMNAVKSRTKTNIPAGQARIASTVVNEGQPIACGDPIRVRVRLIGGLQSQGKHVLSLVRGATPVSQISPEVTLFGIATGTSSPSSTEQRSIEVALAPGEQKDIVLDSGWAMRCMFGSGSFPGLPEGAIVALTPPAVAGRALAPDTVTLGATRFVLSPVD